MKDDELHAVLEWVTEHPSRDKPRSLFAQTLIEAAAATVWVTIGTIALMVIGAPFMFLWFLVIFN